MSNSFVLQNVVSRITHGLIGVDLYMQEKKENEYLEDFLSLEIKEISQALTSLSPSRLVPNSQQMSMEDFGLLVEKIANEVPCYIIRFDKTGEVVKVLEKHIR